MKLPLTLAAIAAIAAGMVGLYITNFPEYMLTDPATCNNCHVMGTVYESWYHSQHRQWATCSDCHTPHELVPKYVYKGWAGMRDVYAFTTGQIPHAIYAQQITQDIVQENCLRCHGDTVSAIADGQKDAGRYCFDCHRTDPHGMRGHSIYQ
jgi:cytochrome c nitrite reductase small subunit